MFVGHYGAALALKGVENKASLGLLFLGVQFVDLLFFPLVLAGVEQMNIVPGHTESTHFELSYMPFTHSLVASVLWAALVAGGAFVALGKRSRRRSIALVLGVAVLSHWVLDLIVHTPDLPLLGDASIKLGFGLWNSAPATFILEAVLLAGGLWIYLRATAPKAGSRLARFGMVGLVVLLIGLNVYNLFGPPPAAFMEVFGFAMASYLGFAGIAFWLDGLRMPAHAKPEPAPDAANLTPKPEEGSDDNPTQASAPAMIALKPSGTDALSEAFASGIARRLDALEAIEVVANDAQETRISHLLRCSINTTESGLTATAMLLDTDTGLHVWSQAYSGEAGTEANIQEKIVSAIEKKLRPSG